MAFKSTEELISMVEQDPEMAKDRIRKAKKKNIPVVDSENQGYSKFKFKSSAPTKYRQKAITKRMSAVRGRGEGQTQPTIPSKQATPAGQSRTTTKPTMDSKYKAIEQRMASTKKVPSTEDEAVIKRKKVGY